MRIEEMIWVSGTILFVFLIWNSGILPMNAHNSTIIMDKESMNYTLLMQNYTELQASYFTIFNSLTNTQKNLESCQKSYTDINMWLYWYGVVAGICSVHLVNGIISYLKDRRERKKKEIEDRIKSAEQAAEQRVRKELQTENGKR